MHDSVDVPRAEDTVEKIAIRYLANHQTGAVRHGLSMTAAKVVEYDDLMPSLH
jgi:hypothetical protein